MAQDLEELKREFKTACFFNEFKTPDDLAIWLYQKISQDQVDDADLQELIKEVVRTAASREEYEGKKILLEFEREEVEI